MKAIKTKYGELYGLTRYDTYSNGQINECNLNKSNQIITDYGTFVPQYMASYDVNERLTKNRSSIQFHKNGELKSLALETQSDVRTPLGVYPAELITFHANGKLNRIFPLNGQINGFWSEEDEGKMAEHYLFEFEFGTFSARIISLRFYPSGNLKSLTLWPGEVITLKTPVGTIDIRTGFSLYENGTLKSIEPAKPTALHTPIGSFLSYDDDALGIHADLNSIKFDAKGNIIGFKSSTNGVKITDKDGHITTVGPREVPSYVDVTENVIMPITVTLDEDSITIYNGHNHQFNRHSNVFGVYISTLMLKAGCTNCSACNSCG